MLKKILESTLGPITKSELKEILDLADTDIKINRIAFSKRTSPANLVEIAVSCFAAMSRGNAA